MTTTRHLLKVCDETDTDEEWIEDQDASPCLRAKILSLKIRRNCRLAHAAAEMALDIALPVLRTITALLDHGSSFTRDAASE